MTGSEGSVSYDRARGNWRVAVMIHGERIHRRAPTYTEAEEIRRDLLGLRDRDNLWRVRLINQRAFLDLSGLNDRQVGAILELVETLTAKGRSGQGVQADRAAVPHGQGQPDRAVTQPPPCPVCSTPMTHMLSPSDRTVYVCTVASCSVGDVTTFEPGGEVSNP